MSVDGKVTVGDGEAVGVSVGVGVIVGVLVGGSVLVGDGVIVDVGVRVANKVKPPGLVSAMVRMMAPMITSKMAATPMIKGTNCFRLLR